MINHDKTVKSGKKEIVPTVLFWNKKILMFLLTGLQPY